MAPGMILGLDIGDVRVGVAVVHPIAKLPRPLQILPNNEAVYDQILQLAQAEAVSKIVVGLPRNMAGAETAQSQKVRQFVTGLRAQTELPVVFADESLSSVRAESLPLPKGRSAGDPLDDLAACLILEEFLQNEASEAVHEV
jgi:putative Holliday junction resolvase